MNQSILQSAIIGELPVENKGLQETLISINITIPKKKETNIVQKPKLNKVVIDSKNCDSIIENVDTGFGPEQIISIPDCPKKKHYTHLYKENYLGEFKEESEKALARYNLGVYSKTEIDNIVSKIIQENNNFVTKSEVQGMLQELDFVNSVLKSYVDYQIPDNLFKL